MKYPTLIHDECYNFCEQLNPCSGYAFGVWSFCVYLFPAFQALKRKALQRIVLPVVGLEPTRRWQSSH
jgi:hypothetical protein